MPAIEQIDATGAVVGEQAVSDALVETKVNVGLLHEVVRAEQAARRQGTAAAKTRSQVAGSGAKPWRQKGVGRARAGSIRMPHWTGGGVAFPPIPRSHDIKVNRKARAKALRMALGNLAENGRVRVMTGVEFEEPSTKRAASILEGAGLDGPVLVVATADEIATTKSFRNLPRTRVLPVSGVEVQDYLWAQYAVFTEAAISRLEGGGE